MSLIQTIDFSTPNPAPTSNFSVSLMQGCEFREDLKCQSIKHRDGFIQFNLRLDKKQSVLLTFNICSGTDNGVAEGQISIKVNGQSLVNAFDLKLGSLANWAWPVPEELLIAGDNQITLASTDLSYNTPILRYATVNLNPASVLPLMQQIVKVLDYQTDIYMGVTYMPTYDNRFTLLDTPRLWDQSAIVSQPIAACEGLLTEISKTIGVAQNIVDITLLWQTNYGLPSGDFQDAIHDGFEILRKSKKTPLIRIMIGVPFGPIIRQADLQDWLQKTIELKFGKRVRSISNVRFAVQIACCKQSPQSWNHAKIVAADGVRAVVGGHNLWANDYLGANPVHDVSGKIEGSAVSCVHRFCDHLWTEPSVIPHFLVLKDGKFITNVSTPIQRTRTDEGPRAMPNNGTTRILSLGRLGFGLSDSLTVATNASVSARIMAMCRANNIIRISQQSLYFTITGLDGGFDFYTLWAIVKAIQAGVTVQIVVSNEVPVSDGGYQGNLKIVVNSLAALYAADRLNLYHPPVDPERADLAGWASASLNPPFSQIPLNLAKGLEKADCTLPLQELNAKLSVAPLYYAQNINYWQVGGKRKLAANHAKVYIIDDTAFYVGSDNLYLSGSPHGLQEFGHLIEGQDETKDFIQNYWDKLWKNSSLHVLKASIPHNKIPIYHTLI